MSLAGVTEMNRSRWGFLSFTHKCVTTAAPSRRCKSALTGLLRWLCVHSNARRICLPRHPHGNKARAAGLGQSGRCKGDSPGQVFLCSLSLWLLHSFFVFLREKPERVREKWRRDGETCSLRSEAECWSSTYSLAWIMVGVGPDGKVPSKEWGVY